MPVVQASQMLTPGNNVRAKDWLQFPGAEIPSISVL